MKEIIEKKDNIAVRPPVVVVMGHIDHGKTTLLDFIRKTKVTEKEAGGITQHIGAYEVVAEDKDGVSRPITFLDTPGHAAFSKIRSRGAKIADIAILVVAADDGVKQQTEEAINAIKEAKVPFIVAINKMDKEFANSDKVKKELSEKEVFVEGWGGNVPAVNISAKTGEGVDDLLELVLLSADMENLTANLNELASGVVLESKLDMKRGLAATLLARNGVLKQGMFIVAKDALAPVRLFENFLGQKITEAGASKPVNIVGFDKAPEVGVVFQSFESKKDAEKFIRNQVKATIETRRESFSASGSKDETAAFVPVVIKTDVVGSREAVEKLIEKLQTESENKVFFNILRSETGDISEDDVKLASSGKNAIILGFNVKCSDSVKILTEKLNVSVVLFNIIYELEKWFKEETERRTPKVEIDSILGKAKILKIFNDEKSRKIIGVEVVLGKILPHKYARIFRREFLLGEGKIIEIRKFQNIIEEAVEGDQVGLLLQTKVDLAARDILEVFEK